MGFFFLCKKCRDTIVTMETKKSLGVDIGNVIINNRINDPEVTKVDEVVYATFPPTEDVFDSLKKLNDYFNGEVYLISKCTEWAQEQILLWLKAHDFYTRRMLKKKTFILFDNVMKKM